MLISSLKARKNLRLLRWPGLQTIRTSVLSSILWRWIIASESCSERVPAVAQKCSPPWSAALKWPDSLPADASSVREQLALLCKDFMQFSLISWSVWRKMSRHSGHFFFFLCLCFTKFLQRAVLSAWPFKAVKTFSPTLDFKLYHWKNIFSFDGEEMSNS